jgi:putative ABC transport system substrate-binding protein
MKRRIGDRKSEVSRSIVLSTLLFALRLFILAVLLLAPSVPAQTQQPTSYRMGVLLSDSPDSNASRIAALRDGLRELGYDEGQNLAVDYRFAEGKVDRFPGLAAELVSLKPHVLVTSGSAGIRALMKATGSIPIIMDAVGDAVGTGFVRSLAQPGGNLTGLSFQDPDISTKRLEILKEVVPRVTRVAALRHRTSGRQSLEAMIATAQVLKLKLQIFEIEGAKEFDRTFQAAKESNAEAINVLASPIFYTYRKELVDLTTRYRWPGIYENKEFVDVGGLLSYGANLDDLFRRAATYVDKILKGAKPAELPVEQPTKFELVINLKTAKQIGLTIPPNVLARANRVIR